MFSFIAQNQLLSIGEKITHTLSRYHMHQACITIYYKQIRKNETLNFVLPFFIIIFLFVPIFQNKQLTYFMPFNYPGY